MRQDLDGLLKLAGLRGEVFKKVRALGLVSESHGVFGPSNGERHCCATNNRRSWGGVTSSSDALLPPNGHGLSHGLGCGLLFGPIREVGVGSTGFVCLVGGQKVPVDRAACDSFD